MKTYINLTALALAMALGTGAAFGKAHDMGQADGTQAPVTKGFANTGALIQSLTDDDGNSLNGVSGGQNKGQRGALASEAKGDSRTVPVGDEVDPD